jgi:hypothetical protein
VNVNGHEPKDRISPPTDRPRESTDESDLPGEKNNQVSANVTSLRGVVGRYASHFFSHEDVSYRWIQIHETAEKGDIVRSRRFVEARVFVPIRIELRGQMKMMLQMVAVIKPGNCADGTKDKQVAEEIAESGIVENPAMHSIMAYDEETIVTSPD